MIPEFDAAILATLPKAGSKMGFHNLGKQIKGIAKQLSKDSGTTITSAQVNGRVHVLRHHEYLTTVMVQPVSGGAGYQITPKGEQWLAQHNEEA